MFKCVYGGGVKLGSSFTATMANSNIITRYS